MLPHTSSHGAKSVGDGRDGGDARWQLLKQGALYLPFTLNPLIYPSKGQSGILCDQIMNCRGDVR